ncbi:MAG: hypothetical protein FWH48_09950, partial [Oscillospiraceae bacterium]|nr:hypothetical protein [Oscillospiraceae bacterium]
MKFRLCDRCKKNTAMVGFTRSEGGIAKQEWICISCARDLGLKPVTELLEQMGINEEDTEFMAEEITNLLQNEDMFPFLPDENSGANSEGPNISTANPSALFPPSLRGDKGGAKNFFAIPNGPRPGEGDRGRDRFGKFD